MDPGLYTYYRSSASYRVRIALNLKGMNYSCIPVHLQRDGGEQFKEGYLEVNPHRLVPVLDDGNKHINQSLAIMEYLDEQYPELPPLLPEDPADRAYVRALAMDVACEIHPLNNLRVLKYLKHTLELTDKRRNDWVHHWIRLGFNGLEKQLSISARRGRYCFADNPGMADCCLIPQIFNARRFKFDLTPYPVLREIEKNCNSLDAFVKAHPDNQPDSE